MSHVLKAAADYRKARARASTIGNLDWITAEARRDYIATLRCDAIQRLAEMRKETARLERFLKASANI